MPKMIQLRRVPDDVYTVIKNKAAERELSISDFLVEDLTARFTPQLTDAPVKAAEAE
jgi:hypothetical protein